MKPYGSGDLFPLLFETLLAWLALLADLDFDILLRGDILRDLKVDFEVVLDFSLSFADSDLDLSSEESSLVSTGFASLLKSK